MEKKCKNCKYSHYIGPYNSNEEELICVSADKNDERYVMIVKKNDTCVFWEDSRENSVKFIQDN